MVVPFGELIKGWRKQQKLSYKDLGRQSGVSSATLARWEAGQTQPRMAELEAVLTALQVSATQRQEALALIEAPRALEQLRAAAEAGPPVSGDLLRAMRLRRGWTQEETARQAGVAQGTLARWERSLDWPSTERLHALCYALQAREEELLALMQGFRSAFPLLDNAPDLDDIRERVLQSLFYSPVADLDFLGLEAQLWHHSRKHEGAQWMLSLTYGNHARYLAEHQRFDEAARYVERMQQLASSGYREDTGWSAAVVAASRIAGSGGRPLHYRRAMNLLHTWSGRAPVQHNREYQAWVTGEIALYLAKMGQAEAAVQQSRRAIRMAAEVNTVEAWYRHGDYAKVLLHLGRYEEALDESNACLTRASGLPEQLPFLFTRVQALIGACRWTDAAESLQRIDQIVEVHPQSSHHRVTANLVRGRLLRSETAS